MLLICELEENCRQFLSQSSLWWVPLELEIERKISYEFCAYHMVTICYIDSCYSIHTFRFRFPNIMLVYITISRTVFSILHVVGYVDEKALYCTSRDQVTSFENGSPYCTIIGTVHALHYFSFTCACYHQPPSTINNCVSLLLYKTSHSGDPSTQCLA